MAFTLPSLPYATNALEPSIDTMTMEIHHGRHHKAYVDNLNKALEGQPALAEQADRAAAARDQPGAGRHSPGRHQQRRRPCQSLDVLGDHGPRRGGKPTGPLADDITATFGDFATFKTQIKEAGLDRFGSGWAWLVLADGKLKILSSANQDSPYMTGQSPILGVDVWEHAYYLKYQNKRPDYLDAWWNVVNWKAVAERYAEAKAGKL